MGGSSSFGVAGPASECMPTKAPVTPEPSIAPLTTSEVDSILATHIGDCAIGFTVSGFPESLSGTYAWDLNGHYSPSTTIVQGKRTLWKTQDESGHSLDASRSRIMYWCASGSRWVITSGDAAADAETEAGYCKGAADNGDSANPSNPTESSNIWWFHDGAEWQELDGTVQFTCEEPRVDECGANGYHCWMKDQLCIDPSGHATGDWECHCKEGKLAVWSNGVGEVYTAGVGAQGPAECGMTPQDPNSSPCTEASSCCGCVESGCMVMHYSVGTSAEMPCDWWPVEHAPNGVAGCYHSGHSEYGGHVACTPQTAPFPTLAPKSANADPCAGLNDFMRMMQGCPPADPCAGLNDFQRMMQGCGPPPTTTVETTSNPTLAGSCPSDCLGGSGFVRIQRCDACQCSDCAPDLFDHNCNGNVPPACTMPPKPAACPATCIGGAGYVRIEMCGDCICADCVGLFDVNCEGQAPPACTDPPTDPAPCHVLNLFGSAAAGGINSQADLTANGWTFASQSYFHINHGGPGGHYALSPEFMNFYTGGEEIGFIQHIIPGGPGIVKVRYGRDCCGTTKVLVGGTVVDELSSNNQDHLYTGPYQAGDMLRLEDHNVNVGLIRSVEYCTHTSAPTDSPACAMGGFTAAPTGGTCYFDKSRNDCAICRTINGVKGCPCGIFKQGTASYIHQCVRCQGQHPDPNLQGVQTWKHCGQIPKDENDNDCTGVTAYPATLFPSSLPPTSACSGFSGIGNHHVCCPTSCGTCGGHDCQKLPGGADACCEGPILSSGKYCGAHNAPCILSDYDEAGRRSDLLNRNKKVPAWLPNPANVDNGAVPEPQSQPASARLRGAVRK